MTLPQTIEQIVLKGEQRGIAALHRQIPIEHRLPEVVRFVADQARGTVLIATGFYILSGQSVETDGPPGALALGKALASLGVDVAYVTDVHAMGVMRALVGGEAPVEEFPIASVEASDEAARRLLDRYRPSLLIAIERCGPSADGVYRNMRGLDITPYTGRIDRLFAAHTAKLGIGDGGNEIGMGRFADRIAKLPKLPDRPAVTKTTKLVVAGVSNWGAWAVLAGLSQLFACDLLPAPDEEWAWVERCVEAGAVDGFSGERTAKVDGMAREDYQRPLHALRKFIAS